MGGAYLSLKGASLTKLQFDLAYEGLQTPL